MAPHRAARLPMRVRRVSTRGEPGASPGRPGQLGFGAAVPSPVGSHRHRMRLATAAPEEGPDQGGGHTVSTSTFPLPPREGPRVEALPPGAPGREAPAP